ncbi:hypothetical protein BWQ96_03837 [Gracilariopsis chorda]|uniref:FMP27/BLTP2/Hobbit GFWDK motif-containing RBG unit domain-containing protein n=1 Tax=Gracilariopsis chorda TaxID=448386 RepID=A0A2V3IW17_9FLOR|nr:hypothetical protein BWQ96_03837 [Gracilariopsis chorda]|eukprot:PXF46338.1 hypothetical protein BWQ96_03837 [Gracilariopsis chorda]
MRRSPAVQESLYPPIHTSLVLRKGTEINAYLDPRLFTLLRPRRLAILDDLRISIRARDVSSFAPGIFEASVTHIDGELCPGYSRTLRAKLPPSAPATKKPRKPGILRYWEGNGAVHGLSIRFTAPLIARGNGNELAFTGLSLSDLKSEVYSQGSQIVAGGPEKGVFLRVSSIRVEAFGKAADERHEPMTRASLSVRGCSAGSVAVDALSRTLYETMSAASNTDSIEFEGRRVESIENIEKIVAARPEFLMWVEDVTTAVDINCSKRHGMRLDFAGHGGVIALEPVGLVLLANDVRNFVSRYLASSHRRQPSSSTDEDSISAITSRSSTSSLYGADGEPRSLRMMSDMRHWTIAVLGHEPIGAGDTLAMVLSCETLLLPQVDVFGSSFMRFKGSTSNVSLMHWSQWDQTTSFACEEAKFDINRGIHVGKKVALTSATIDWDMDAQSGIECLPDLLRELKKLNVGKSSFHCNDKEDNFSNDEYPEGEKVRSERGLELSHSEKRKRLFQELQTWELSGSNINFTAFFPDGPGMGVSIGRLPAFTLDSESFCGQNVVVSILDKKFAYGSEVRISSPIHTMRRDLEKHHMDVEVHRLCLILHHDFQFGSILQDWILRLRAAIKVTQDRRVSRSGVSSQVTTRRPFPDIRFQATGVQIFFEDHPIGGFLTRMLPLMQDESRERLVREEIMESRIQQLHKIDMAKIAGTSQTCTEALRKSDSKIWLQRVRKLNEAVPPLVVADGHLPPLLNPPMSSFEAAQLSFSLNMDDLVRQYRSEESIRKLKMLDDYELGSKKNGKTRHYDRDAWNSIGFRNVEFEANHVRLRLKDYTYTFVEIDRMYFDNSMIGIGVQATLPPYIAETTLAIGRRRKVKITRALAPSKTFADIHLVIETLQCGYNPSYMGAIVDFGRGVARFFAGGKNPSPRIPWFDSLRVNMHGRMRITARKLKGHLTSSVSPYSMTKHYAEVEAENFEMLTSRLKATKRDPFPICWTLHNWHIRPSSFDSRRKSEVIFKYVRVGLKPNIVVNSGDPQDHYFVLFPSKAEVANGGPGIDRGMTTEVFSDQPVTSAFNEWGNYTKWVTGLDCIPGHDSFKDFKTRSMILGIHVFVRHEQSQGTTIHTTGEPGVFTESSWAPWGASVVHSDAVTTLMRVIKTLVRRPISCRLAPRKLTYASKAPSETGLSNTLCGLDVTIDAKDLNVMLYNNLEPGHGLFLSVKSLSGELRRRTITFTQPNGEVDRISRLTRRRFNIADIYCSIRVPGLDMAVDSGNIGKLLTVDKITLSDNFQDDVQLMTPRSSTDFSGTPSSGFGSDELDESPFYTFSNTHPLQRGKKLDKVQYDKRLLVERVRLIWSPVRRSSLFAWPDAFEEKTFCMKGPKVKLEHVQSTSEVSNVSLDNAQSEKRTKTDPLTDFKRTAELMGDSGEDIPSLDLKGSFSSVEEKRKTTEAQESGRVIGSVEKVRESSINGTSSATIPLQDGSETNSMPRYDPLSPPVAAISRSKATAPRNLVGSMVDILSAKRKPSKPEGSRVDCKESSLDNRAHGCAFEVLRTSPKFQLFINDCQVAFGSPATSGIVFLTSKAVRLGLVDKQMQKNMQLGEKNETWKDREYRVHLDEANLYTRSKSCGSFDFTQKTWIAGDFERLQEMALVTRNPICMDLMYISSSSNGHSDDSDQDDHILRPSLLFINIPDISLSTNAEEFHAATDVVRKVLMQSMRSSEIVNEELAFLRYKLQLADGKVSSDDLDDFMRRLSNITKQCKYAADTFQHNLVASLLLPDESRFSDTLQRYKAKAKAVATFMRQDQRASSTDVLYPTMYVSYSFDKCSWELRELQKELNKETEVPFVEITLDDLLFRHIFYVGKGSSTEMTFGNISAKNKMRSSYFQGILEPATTSTKLGPGGSNGRRSSIKASDGAPVAFRWYSTQADRVGGIPVYELLTIQVAPMTAAITRKLYSSVSNFIFFTRSKADSSTINMSTDESGNAVPSRGIQRPYNSAGGTQSSADLTGNRRNYTPQASGLFSVNANMDDVAKMAKRGESSILFKYVFIDAFELTASYKNKETTARGVLDFFDLFVTTPSFSYSSQIWTWKDFSVQLRKDLVMTFAKRGVSNLAKIKLLPGYSKARRRLVQGADSMMESIVSRLPTSVSQSEAQELSEAKEEDGVQRDALNVDDLPYDVEDDEREAAIDAALADISGEEGIRREKVLRVLFGSKSGMSRGTRFRGPPRSPGSYSSLRGGSESSIDSGASAHGRAGIRGTILGDRGTGVNGRSKSGADEEGPRRFLSRIRRRGNGSSDGR